MPVTRPALLRIALALLFSCGVLALSRAEAEPLLQIDERARVVEVIDGDTVLLDNGMEVRLVGTQAPKLPLGRKGFVAWPLAEEAKSVLEDLVLDRDVGLGYGGRKIDRHGRLLAHLWRDDDLWVQGAMVAEGWARVYGFVDNRALLDELFDLEGEARVGQRGIWGDNYYAIRSAYELARDGNSFVDSFQLVEGRVESAAIAGGRAYLNFGSDWKSDTTAVLQPEIVDLFADEGIDPTAFEGHLVRIRGWVELYNGPMIEITYPEQIEILE